MDYHPSKHVNPNSQFTTSTNHPRSRRRACSSCKARQYFDLSNDERQYLVKLKASLLNINWKLYHNVTKTYYEAASKETGKPPHTIHRGSHSRQK